MGRGIVVYRTVMSEFTEDGEILCGNRREMVKTGEIPMEEEPVFPDRGGSGS